MCKNMETKKFTVVDTETQTYKTIESTATTLGELKVDLQAAGFNLEGKAIQEAYTKTEMLNDASILPTNVEVTTGCNAGTTTNNLVFRLTRSNKNIRSGASRAQLYKFIRDNNLQEEITAAFGSAFTNLSNEVLESFIASKKSEPEEDYTCANNAGAIKDILTVLLEELAHSEAISPVGYAICRTKLQEIDCSKVEAGIDRDAVDKLLSNLD